MRNVELGNFPAFFRAEGALARAGWRVYNPAKMSCGVWRTAKTLQRSVDNPRSNRQFARDDVRILLDVLKPERGDAVVVLPRWRRSRGARAEVAMAVWVGLPIFTVRQAVALGGYV